MSDVAVITVELPIYDLSHFQGYRSRRLDLTLTAKQAEALKSLLHGLTHKAARTLDGHDVMTGRDAVRYTLEQISDAAMAAQQTRPEPPKTRKGKRE